MMKQWHVGHRRTGWMLHVYQTPWWTLVLANVAGTRPVTWALTRWGWTYRLWNWLLTWEDRRATKVEWIPVTPDQARALSWDPTWVDDIMADPDYLPDGSMKKELWR